MKKNNLTVLFIVLFLSVIISGCSSVENTLEKGTKPNTSSSIPFPRLGMWWPDPWEQSLDDIARYDWVILFPYMEEFIDPIKKINPEILLFTSNNACELWYDSTGVYPENNSEVLAVPPEWFLTQVGTVLTRDVNKTSTVFHIDQTSITNGEEIFQLFIPGDTVLVEGESVLVESVNEITKTLNVQRGFVRPASAHISGTRIAAHISFWPNSWLLNLSRMSPEATANTTIGRERWADYNARIAAGLLTNPLWDGILLDRADPNQSWLIGGSTARTIDPNQSNTLITDYSVFDESWNEGLIQYEIQLREMIGDKKLILANWSIDNYDLLNGNNFEGFPLDNSESYQSTWRQTVFGYIPDIGSYMDWLDKGLSPNITMIETYEDDGSPEATYQGSYNNPYDDSLFVPNYQKMRFGLTTALLGDGYYSYEINTNGHGSLGLLWFDEYDNAGGGRGYLGLPQGSAYVRSDISLKENILPSGSFNNSLDLGEWNFWADDGHEASIKLERESDDHQSKSVKINIFKTYGKFWQIALSHKLNNVVKNEEYTLTFWAKAEEDHQLSLWVQKNSIPWNVHLDFGSVLLSNKWKYFEIAAEAKDISNDSVFEIGFGEKIGTVWLDDVRLQRGNKDVWQRDYEGGIVLVNATADSKTIDLNGEFRKIKGLQIPEINDGNLVTQVELKPYDGIILLRNY